MGKPRGFLEYSRTGVGVISPAARIADFQEFRQELSDSDRAEQGARCMDCGVPFCQSSFGCPVDNLIPEWNDLIYRGRWEEAWWRLMETNNFPEFTGRVCPAPCEHACVLGINDPAVTIKDNEAAIIDRAYRNGLMVARSPSVRTGRRVAIVGSGPAGLAAADQLNQVGHTVEVYERGARPGGLLMYGIPNMKLDKRIVARRTALLEEEGVAFRCSVDVGRDVTLAELRATYDAVVLAVGSTQPRTLPEVCGRGVETALDYLSESTRVVNGEKETLETRLDARDKDVVVIGGGDTGNDCIATAVRQGARSVVNLELLPKPPVSRDHTMPWPTFAKLHKDDYGHAEARAHYGGDPRQYATLTKGVERDTSGGLVALQTVGVQWRKESLERPSFTEVPRSERRWPVDIVLLALGFTGPERYVDQGYPLRRDPRGNLAAPYGLFTSSSDGVFVAGDARRGQSLVVWAINEGRGVAREVDRYLMGETVLS